MAGSTDRLTAVDVVIIRELGKDAGVHVRWAPGDHQIADGLTKNKEEPALRLKGALREGACQLADAGEILRQNKLEEERQQRQKEANQQRNEFSKKAAKKEAKDSGNDNVAATSTPTPKQELNVHETQERKSA